MLSALGAQGFGPYYVTSDLRTQTSFEFTAFRETVLRHASEGTVARTSDSARAVRISLRLLHRRIERQEFGPYESRGSVPVFFKYPLSALLIPQICQTFDTRLVYVVRPLEDIEQTRRRRGWGWQFGRAGAEILYREMLSAAQSQSHPILEIDYPRLLASRTAQARELAHFAGLTPSARSLEDAIQFIRSADAPDLSAHSSNSCTRV
jgi:hypothetical protein